jgi:hypothetical protein
MRGARRGIMNASKHTPGPWVTRGQTVMGEYGVQVAWCGEATTCSADYVYSIDHEEAEHNARLIAAAPDMLAVLETILDVWDDHKIIGPTVYHDARAIIASAKGA